MIKSDGSQIVSAAVQAVMVCGVREEALGIRSFRLVSANGSALPPYKPGAYIEIAIGPGVTRAYSLCGAADDGSYTIAVQRVDNSTGGSQFLHDKVTLGQQLSISPPKGNFGLSDNDSYPILIAGGIGVTPLLSMAYHLARCRRPFELHYFCRSAEHAAFREECSKGSLRKSVVFHPGLDEGGVLVRLQDRFSRVSGPTEIYTCGPAALMNMVIALAAEARPDMPVHRENFSPDISQSIPFEITLKRSGQVLSVSHDKSILQVLEANGVKVKAICRQGTCGSCLTTVLAGTPDHRDSFLTSDERAVNDLICVCVSRAAASGLTLDV